MHPIPDMSDSNDANGGTGRPVDAATAGWIAHLLRLTGPRPPAPPERAARVKAAVHAHWHARLDHRRRTRRMWTGISMAVAASLLVTSAAISWRLLQPTPVAAIAGRVEHVVFSSWAFGTTQASSLRRPLSTGEALPAGTRIETEAAGRLALRLVSGHALRLDAGTSLTLLSERSIALHRGAVYVDSGGPRALATPMEIRTSLGAIRDVGTQFEVRWMAEGLQIRVREGLVQFGAPGEAIEVGMGQQLEIDAHGAIRSQAMDAVERPWDWIGDAAPPFAIDGRPLGQFLEWVRRERGLGLRFSDPELEGEASAIILKGSIQGLTSDQAIESVLATCGFRHRLEGGVLVIERLAGPEKLR